MNKYFILFLFLLPAMIMADDVALLVNDLGARPSAMGGAYCAEYGEVNSALYNPASPGYKPRTMVGSTFFSIYETDVKEIAAIYPTQMGVFSGSLVMGSMLGIPYSEVDPATDKIVLSGGSFGYGLTRLMFGWADRLGKFYKIKGPLSKVFDNIYTGAQLEYVGETLEKASASAFLINVGGFYPYSDRLFLGVKYRNIIGTPEQWSGGGASAQEPIESSIRLGAKYIIDPGKLSVNGDYLFATDGGLKLGVSYQIRPELELMAGTGLSAFNLGLRFNWLGWVFDYAYSSQRHELLDAAHRISIGYAWGPLLEQVVAAPQEETQEEKIASPKEEETISEPTRKTVSEADLIQKYRKTLEPREKVQVLKDLRDFGGDNVKQLYLQILAGDDIMLKKVAVGGMIASFPADSIEPLVNFVFDENKELRTIGAYYLGKVGDKKVLSILKQVLPLETEEDIRAIIRESISQLEIKLQ